MVVRQNLETSSQQALEERGKRVRLSWRPEHTYEIGRRLDGARPPAEAPALPAPERETSKEGK
jgi:hypothetical protein